MGFKPASDMRPLMTTFVEVLINVTELERMEANASGMSSTDGDTLAFAATPSTTGKKNAAAAVLLMKALNVPTLSMITSSNGATREPAWRMIPRPTKSTTPVFTKAVVMMSRPRIIKTVSLPNPANASFAGTNPVIASARRRPSPTTSLDTHSTEKNTTATVIRLSSKAIWIVTGPS